jgi:hypothetical protein
MGSGGNAHRARCCELVAVGVVVVTSSLALPADVAVARRQSSVVRCSSYVVRRSLFVVRPRCSSYVVRRSSFGVRCSFVRCPPLSVVGRAGDVAATGVAWLRGGR